LIHDFGRDVLERHIGKPDEFYGLDDLHKQLKHKIESEVRPLV
jgi:hypothetical protein